MKRGTIVWVKVRKNKGPWYIQSFGEEAVVVTFSEYSESFAAHQMTVLSCSMTGTCWTTPPVFHYHRLLLQLSCLGPASEAGLQSMQ